MNLLHLRYFLDVARMESISRAAELNHIAQPAMSRAVSLLEKKFGVPLFDRVGRNIRLNTCGKILMDSVEQSIAILDSVQDKINFARGQVTGKVTVMLQAPARHFGELCASFRKIYPLVELDIQKPLQQSQTHLGSDADLYVYMGPASFEGNYESKPLLTQDLVVVVKKENPLFCKEWINISELAQQELILPQFMPIRNIIHSYCNVAGFIPKEIGSATHPEGQRVLIDTFPQKRAIVGQKDMETSWGEKYKVIPICDSFCKVDINLAWSLSNELRPSTEAFRDYALHFYLEEDELKNLGILEPTEIAD